MYEIKPVYQGEIQERLKKFEVKGRGKLKHVHPHNNVPPNWKEITREAFERVMYHGSYMPELIDWRQVHHLKSPLAQKEMMATVRLYIWHDNTGVAVASFYHGMDKNLAPIYAVRFYTFAVCEHTNVLISEAEYHKRGGTGKLFRTNHAYGCIKCDYFYVIDSSD